MDTILNSINMIQKKMDTINNITGSFTHKITKTNAQLAENVRNYITKESNLLQPNEILFPIKADGHCEFRALAKIIYNNDDDNTTHQVRREIVKYMIKSTFGGNWHDDHVKLFDDLVIKKKGIDMIGLDAVVIDTDDTEKWENNFIPLFEPLFDFHCIKESTIINEKVLCIICTFMKGLPEIDKLIPPLDENAENIMFKGLSSSFNEIYLFDICGIELDKIKSNKDVAQFIKTINEKLALNVDLDDIIDQTDEDTYDDIVQEYNKGNFGIQQGDIKGGSSSDDDSPLFDIDDTPKQYYKNLNQYIKETIVDQLEASLNPPKDFPIAWGDGSLIPFMASKLYEITICLHQVTYDETAEYYKLAKCEMIKILLIKNIIDTTPRKLLFHDFTIRGHFDVIIDLNHTKLNKEALVQSKLA